MIGGQIYEKYYGVLDNDKKVILHKVDKELLDLGKMKIKSPQGQVIEVYDIERCLCDCLKDKNIIASEYIKITKMCCKKLYLMLEYKLLKELRKGNRSFNEQNR